MKLEDDEEYINAKPQHQVFIHNLLKGNTLTKAYQLAYPTANERTAATKGCQLKKKFSGLLDRVQMINEETLEKVSNQTLHNLTLMAFADLGEIVEKNGTPKPLYKIPRHIRMAITEVEIEGKRVKYKVGGKLKALEILSKIARLQNDNNEINISLITEEERNSKIREIVVNAMNRNGDDDEGGENN